jgi:hypothetical protein
MEPTIRAMITPLASASIRAAFTPLGLTASPVLAKV